MIVVFMHGTVQSVLNWDDCLITFSIYKGKKNLFEGFSRYGNRIFPRQRGYSNLGKCAQLP